MSEDGSPELLELAGRLLREIGSLADSVTIVGGLAPGLLIPRPPEAVGPHPGTADVDLGLSIAWADDTDDFVPLDPALKKLGLRPLGANRWLSAGGIVVDFLCGVPRGFQELSLVHVTTDLAACAFPATPLAALDREPIEVLVDDEQLTIWVCGLGAFLALKVDAIRMRSKPRDAFDVVWVLRAWDGGPSAVAERIASSPIAEDPMLIGRLQLLPSLFDGVDSEGARLYAGFFDVNVEDQARRAVEAVVTVGALLEALRA